MRVIGIILALTGATVASAATIQDFLTVDLGPPQTVEDLGPGEPYVIDSGMHEGHQALKWPAMSFPAMEPPYAARYNVCTDHEAHPRMIGVWPREGGAAVGLTRPTSANFYGGGFLDVLIDDVSVGPYKRPSSDSPGRRRRDTASPGGCRRRPSP